MKKKILALLFSLISGVAFSQTINGKSPAVLTVDGANVTAVKVLTLPQVQSTVGVTPTPQTSSWYQLNGNGAVLVEFSGNTFTGTYSVQVSNNLTPVSTPGTNLYTVVKDTSTFTSGGSLALTKNWYYVIRSGWRYIRFLCTPETGNTGTLNIQARVFGNPPTGDAARSYTEGIPWQDSDTLVSAVSQTAVTNYYDYKLPTMAKGLYMYQNISTVSGAATLIANVEAKDPTSGQIVSLTGNTMAASAVSYAGICLSGAITGTGPTGLTFYQIPAGNHLVVKDTITGTGNCSFSQTIVPIY